LIGAAGGDLKVLGLPGPLRGEQRFVLHRPIGGGIILLLGAERHLVLADHRARAARAREGQRVATVRVGDTAGARSGIFVRLSAHWRKKDDHVGEGLAVQGNSTGNGNWLIRPTATAPQQGKEEWQNQQPTHGLVSSVAFVGCFLAIRKGWVGKERRGGSQVWLRENGSATPPPPLFLAPPAGPGRKKAHAGRARARLPLWSEPPPSGQA